MDGIDDPVQQLLIDYLLRWEQGETPDPDEYLRRLTDEDQRQQFRELLSCVQCIRRVLPAALRPHAILADRYELVEELGSGGFGKVWRARDRQLDRMVAVKVLNLVAAESADVERYHRHEMQALSRLQHPGVVHIHAAGEYDGKRFLVMDLIAGRSLAQVIPDLADVSAPDRIPELAQLRRALCQPCPPGVVDLVAGSYAQTAARITGAVLRTLEAAHAIGVLHRDLKPANVMLTGGAHPVLLDFGMASLGDQASGVLTDRLIGTANYLAPEQIRTHRIGRSALTDVYQVGLLLYEVLTLRPAFSPQEGISTIPDRILRGDYPRPRQVRPEIPEPLEAVCLRALQHRPQRRFASATEFRAALEQWLERGTLPAGVPEVPVPADDLDPSDPRRYEVRETLVRNEFETVQSAWDRFLRCEVVLKRAGPGLLSPNLRRRIRREAERLMRVQHAGIVRLLQVFQDEQDLVLVMEPLRGERLAERLRLRALPVPEVRRLGVQLCDALEALHRVGVVHCCLGPETVWVNEQGRAKITGFTFARELGSGTVSSSISSLGFDRLRPEAPSPAYVAPEQQLGQRPDARTDIWALGCLLYRCLTGRDPKLGGKVPPDPRAIERSVPRALAKVVRRCMQVPRTGRYSTARELAEALG